MFVFSSLAVASSRAVECESVCAANCKTVAQSQFTQLQTIGVNHYIAVIDRGKVNRSHGFSFPCVIVKGIKHDTNNVFLKITSAIGMLLV